MVVDNKYHGEEHGKAFMTSALQLLSTSGVVKHVGKLSEVLLDKLIGVRAAS